VSILVDLQRVTFHGADRPVLENLSLTVSDGERIGVVGINGAGKSALLSIIRDDLIPDAGEVRRPRDLRVGVLEQEPSLPDSTVREALGSGWQVDAALDRLGMLGFADALIHSLSGGQRKRVALARVFSRPVDLLVLDEPTNHLDLNAIRWLEQQLLDFSGGVVLVSHDRFLLDQVTTRMVEIDRGSTYVHAGGYSRLLEAQAEREARATTAEQVRRNLARTELAWLRRGVKARSTKPQARIDAAHRLLAGRPDAPARSGPLDLSVQTPRLGTTVIKAHRVSFGYGDETLLRDVDLELGPGDRVGIVGPNGAGKSTLLDLLAQRQSPTSGTIKHGSTVVVSYFEQHDRDLDPAATVQELVAGPRGVPGSPADVALMKRFWFTGALPATKSGELSGGERQRLQLLLALAKRPNVLFLDEPTNDLDLETIRLIEDFLSEWPGTLIIASHDRTFLSRTTDRLLEVRAGTVSDVAGGIDAWIARTLEPASAPDAETTAPAVPRGRALRDAEKEMTRLERRKQTLTEKLLGVSNRDEQTRLGVELDTVLRDLHRAETAWLEFFE
jgi:ATP-binding cassette subfamily F protein uup